MKTGASPRSTLLVRPAVVTRGGPVLMLHVGLDLSRTRVDVHVMDEAGAPVLVTTAAPDSGGVGPLGFPGGGVGPPGGAGVESVDRAPLLFHHPGARGWGGADPRP